MMNIKLIRQYLIKCYVIIILSFRRSKVVGYDLGVPEGEGGGCTFPVDWTKGELYKSLREWSGENRSVCLKKCRKVVENKRGPFPALIKSSSGKEMRSRKKIF